MSTDAIAFKDATRIQWDAAAAGWNRHAGVIRHWLQTATAAMIAMAGVAPGQSVLDVAAGAGDQTLDLADRVGPAGQVTATDISAAILAFAKANARSAGHRNVTTHLSDAEALGLPDASFDAAVCRLGLMFLPDPLSGLTGIARTLKPGARFCSMVFAGPEQNPLLRIQMATALRHAGLPMRDPFQPGGLLSLGRPGHLDDLFRKAGFKAVATTSLAAPFCVPATEDYLAFLRDAAGPILQILAPLSASARAAAWADIAAQLAVFQTNDGWSGPNTLLLTVGERG